MSDDAHFLFTQAQAMAAQGQWDQACALYRTALAADPAHAESANGLGAALCTLGRYEEGAAWFRQAQTSAPHMATAAANLGGALQAMGHWDQAIDSMRQAIAHTPHYPPLHYNLGHALHHQGRFEEAAASYRSAVNLAPQYREAWTNLGATLRELGQLDPAIAALDHALILDMDHGFSHFNRAFILLQKGEMGLGWAEHEWRFAAGITHMRSYPQPLWAGEPMAGKTLLVWAEQGLGDTVQFARFLPFLTDIGIKVVFEVQPQLYRLLQGIKGAAQVIAQGGSEQTPAFDRHIPLMSLPFVLKIGADEIPHHCPYIPVPSPAPSPAPSSPIMASAAKKPRIGLAWAGSPSHKNDQRRSLDLGLASRLSTLPGVDWISLQVGAVPHPAGLAPPPQSIVDFKDTAALIETLDLVISVDTAVAHVAGALGVPVWLLLAFAPDWRWLMDTDHSPWYPTMRLFRQPKRDDWDSVMQAVERQLSDVRQWRHGQSSPL